MKLKWINRNIEKEVLIDNPIESNFSEDLDSATVKILSQTERLEVEILDEVALVNDDDSVFKYFCIADYDETEMNPAEPHYDYTFSLVSQTKELEGIVLPNLSITKTDEKRSVLYYINNYLDLYAPKIRKTTSSRLPIEYQEVEYIESTGTQYIDTGITPDNNSLLMVKYSLRDNIVTSGIAGTRESSSLKGFCFGFYGPNGKRYAQYGNELYDDYGIEAIGANGEQWLDKNTLYNGNTITYNFVNQEFKGYGNIYLFAINEPTLHPCSMRFYSCYIAHIRAVKTSDNYDDLLYRDFVPCYRKLDGTVGLYDLISRKFFENAGTGTFAKGPDVTTTGEISFERKWILNPVVEEKFKNILCPEIQWNRPTLREVLTDLMMVANCIPVLNNNEISLFDLGKRLDTKLNEEDIISVNRSKSIEDYTTEVEMELQNVIQDSEDDVYNLTNITEYIGFRNENEYALTDQNVKVYTKNPIYDIKHLWLCAVMHIEYRNALGQTIYHQYNYVEVDLCNIHEMEDILMAQPLNFVREYKEYITLPILYDGIVANTLSKMNKYQNFSIHYQRGGKEIDGFYDETKKAYFVSESFLEKILSGVAAALAAGKTIPFISYYKWGTISKPIPPSITDIFTIGKGFIDQQDFSFKVEYQSLANTKFKAGKYLPYENERIIVDNQTNSYVNASKQGILEYLKANRLGNELLIISSRIDNLSDARMVEVGSTYKNDYVIFKRSIQINPNYVNVIYYATKHYVLRDYFTGVKAKIRSWKIESEESLVRNDLHKYYYEFSFDNRVIDDSDFLPVSENMMLSSFMTHYEDEVMKYGFIQSVIGYDLTSLTQSEEFMTVKELSLPAGDRYSVSPSYEYLITELNNKVMGNTIVFDTQMTDNWSGGVRITGRENITSILANTSYPIEEDVRYVDDFGELRKVNFTMASEMNINKSDSNLWLFPIQEIKSASRIWYHKYSVVKTDGDNLVNLFKNKPLASDNIFIEDAEKYEETFDVFKDQREVTALSLQLEYCSDNENIVFGSQLMKDNNLVSTNYRTKYQDVTYTIVGELVAIGVYTVVQGQLEYAPTPEPGQLAIGKSGDVYYYYTGVLQNAFGELYSSDTTVDKDTVIALGSELNGKYMIGVEYTYSYPIPSGATYKNIASTDIPEDINDLSANYSASNYAGKYMVSKEYSNLRMLYTTATYTYSYENVSVGQSTGIHTPAPDNYYAVVKHTNDSTSGYLASTTVYNWGPSSQKPDPALYDGKYLMIYYDAVIGYRLYKSVDGHWGGTNGSNYISASSLSSSNLYRYSNKNYYWNNTSHTWVENTGFTYQLLRSESGVYYLEVDGYIYDSNHVYYYRGNYKLWINSAWINPTEEIQKSYYWFQSNGDSWVLGNTVSNGEYSYVGDTIDDLDTEWFSFNITNWKSEGKTVAVPLDYELYTYSGGSVSAVPLATLTDNLFRYDSHNVKWNMSNSTSHEGVWEIDDVIVWTQVSTAEGKYFGYEGDVFKFTNGQLLYQESKIPIRKVKREDLKMFRSPIEKVRIYDQDFLPNDADTTEVDNWAFSIINNYIYISSVSLVGDTSYFITDSNNNVLLAFNAPEETMGYIRIYLNGYCSRNKKIYN